MKIWVCELYENGERNGPVRLFSTDAALAAFVRSQADTVTTVSYEQIVDTPDAFDPKSVH